jgi:hypothetical protein
MVNKTDLNCEEPEQVAQVLRYVADQYRQSAADLEANWQDKNAGKCWIKFAAILERAAASCDKVAI